MPKISDFVCICGGICEDYEDFEFCLFCGSDYVFAPQQVSEIDWELEYGYSTKDDGDLSWVKEVAEI